MLRLGSNFFFQSTCFATKRPLAIVSDVSISPLEVDAKKYIKIFNKFNLPTGTRACIIFKGKRCSSDQLMNEKWNLMDQDEKEVLKT